MANRRGLALILVAGVLGILAVLAAAFVTMAQMERRASLQRLHATRAQLLARSGLEDALARLSAGQDPLLVSTRYGGEDWNGDGALSSREAASEVYHPTGANSPADTESCPVRDAMRPSFWRAQAGSPGLLVVDGRERGCSGKLSGDLAGEGNTYALKVQAGGIFVNGGDPSAPPGLGYNAVLRRILGILAEAIDREDGVPLDGPVGQTDGFNLVDARSVLGRPWRDFDEIRDQALGGSQAKLDALRPYLALNAWVDRKVIAPNAQAGMQDQIYHSWGEMKLARPVGALGKEPDFERINGRIVGRAPVDLAWARTRRPVLIALLAGLKDLYLDEAAASPITTSYGRPPDAIGRTLSVEITLDWTAASDDCRQMADQILAFDGELGTWEQWNAFCDTLLDGTTLAATLAAYNAATAAYTAALADYNTTLAAYNAAFTAYNAAFTAYNAATAAYNAAFVAYNASPSPRTLATLNAALAVMNAAQDAYNTALAAKNAAEDVYTTAIATLEAALAAKNAAQATYDASLADDNAAQAERSLLKASFNPNSDLNKFSPNLSLWRPVDKSDLLVYSTEFSLLPRARAQSLECVGRVLGRDGRVLASRVLRASIAPAGILTISTQKEFVCEDLGDPSVAGDETPFRLPGQTPFISQNWGAGIKTWGHALGQSGLDTSGASLQTYPEPCVKAGAAASLSVRPADYDGSVQLATVETPADDTYTVTNCTSTDMKLLARYTAGLDLDVADATQPPVSNPLGDLNQPDIQQVTYNSGGSPDLSELGNGLLDAARPNTLYPDGIYSEKDRAPSYLSLGNANGFHGVLSFWIKSNVAPPTEASDRGHPFFKWTNFSTGIPGAESADQFFFLGDGGRIGYYPPAGPSCQFEVGHGTFDVDKEHRFRRDRFLTPHQWSLVTMYYDFRSPTPDKDNCGELLLNAGIADEDKGSADVYGVSNNDPPSAADITLDHLLPDGSSGPHRLVLGKGRPESELHDVAENTGSGADASFDELAIYDFGGATLPDIPAPPATLASPGVLAASRFKEGRYYKESDYAGLGGTPGLNTAAEYFSPLISLGPCWIKAIAWTQVVPRGLKSPLPAGGQAGVDGDPGSDGAILLELANDSGGNYLQDAAGHAINQTFDRPASSRVDRPVNAPFRLHAVFRPNLADKDNTPILDPLALDDVTVVYEAMEGRRILSWDAP